MNRMPWHIAVLIPARDEERLIGRCLRSVVEARRLLPDQVSCDIVVVSDSSIDRTEAIADDLLSQGPEPGMGVAVSARNESVGLSRALAAQVALTRYRGQVEKCWLANTDADCEVPPTWLLQHWTHAQQGWAAIAGIVDVDSFADHGLEVPERFRTSYITHEDGTHPHVHGANLGLRAEAYLQVGGWAPLVTAEDHDLWGRLRGAGLPCLADARLCVLTSGRRVGRAPLGFAHALAMHNEAAS